MGGRRIRTRGLEMSKKNSKEKPVKTLIANDPARRTGILKQMGGSMSDTWNQILGNQCLSTLWLSKGEEGREQQFAATVDALVGIGPKDELEGMMAAQLLAAHNAAMECYRRAMLGEQTFEGWRENLNQANKLSRTYATLLEALNRHRGKGQQKVTVEHVHVHAGGQAVVGVVENSGKGSQAKSADQCDAKQIAHAPQPTMRSTDAERQSLPVASDVERALPNARRNISGSTKGK
jgi:hypothetical protein